MIDLNVSLGALRRQARVIETQVSSLSAQEARWKPSEGRWSALEVVCHLADEEREDFRVRLDLTLHHPDRE